MRNSGKGLTLIEILVLLAALAVVVAFTSQLLRDRMLKSPQGRAKTSYGLH